MKIFEKFMEQSSNLHKQITKHNTPLLSKLK